MGTPRQRGARRGACQEVICRLAVGSTFSWRGLTSRAPVRATTKSRGDRTWTAGTAVSRIKRLREDCGAIEARGRERGRIFPNLLVGSGGRTGIRQVFADYTDDTNFTARLLQRSVGRSRL